MSWKMALGGLGLAICAAPALAQTPACAPRDQVVDQLARRYGEVPQSIGLGSDNAVMEVFASAETGTWTITVTTPAGLTCLLASGQAFEVAAALLTPPGSDA
ncbi:hypothetical protein ACFSDD_15900 [Salipiger marinus]|uniref:hypothetical protein n=1 Tax=Salipiger marinus TaxID=555512 RepID=UPI002CF44A65|nr:hypothetical protein [Salipiger manganoxidans]MEB3418412.1 hypothetical protein [Salipiger manganoxidans]